MNTSTGTSRSFATLALGLLLAAGHALAQSETAKLPDPADAEATVPTVEYRSPLKTFRTAAEVPLGDWKAANVSVTKTKGAPPAASSATTNQENHSGHQHGQTAPPSSAPPKADKHEHEAMEACDMASMKHGAAMSMADKAAMKMPNCRHPMHNSKDAAMNCEHDAMKHGDHHDHE